MRPHMVFWALLAVGSGVSAEPLALTADQAVERALTSNLTLLADEQSMLAKKRSNDFVWNAFVPKVSAAGAMSKFNEPAPLLGIPSHWVASGQLSAQLNLSLALFDGMRHTALDYQSSLIQYDTARRKLARDTRKAFYNLVLMKENVATFEAQVETTRKRYEKEKRNFEGGLGSEFTMLSAQVALENMKPVLADMRIGLQMALLQFKLLLGVERVTEVELVGDVELKDVELDEGRLVTLALTNNGDLAALRKALEIQTNLRNAKFNLTYLPVLGFSYTADPTFQKDPSKYALFSDIANDWKQSSGMFSLSLSMSLDGLLPFSTAGVELANMDNTVAQLRATLEAASQGTETQIAGLVMRLQKSRTSLQTLNLNVDLANRAYQMAERGYNSGAYELLEVEDAENKLRESKFSVLQEKFAYLSSLFDLEYETNQILTVK